ncbi:MAG: hypothetical protein V8T86_16055 [Victivallis sp.]
MKRRAALRIGISAAAARAVAARGRIFPAALDFLAALPVLKGRKEFQLRQLAAMILAADRFRQARMFRYFQGGIPRGRLRFGQAGRQIFRLPERPSPIQGSFS